MDSIYEFFIFHVIWSKNQLTTKQWLISDEVYAECLEAIIGAAYFDKGLKKQEKFFGVYLKLV